MDKNSIIYVAGHKGMVGSAIVKTLKVNDYKNIVTKTRDELNLLDNKEVTDFINSAKPQYVIISAARVGGIKANMTYPAEFLYENLQIQNNIIWASLNSNVEKLLFLGSSCIYPRNSQQPMREDYLLDGKPEPTNEGYALAKIAGMKLCEYIYTEYDKRFISCMPTNIYGENDNFNPESSHVIPSLIKRMLDAEQSNTESVVVWGTGSTRREFLHVDDLANAVLWIMNNYDDKPFLNIGTGNDVSIKELAVLIKKLVGYNGQLVFDSTKPDGMPKKLLDVSKIESRGWRHNIDLEAGLIKTIAWYKENGL